MALIGQASVTTAEEARTRFVIGLEKPVPYQIQTLTGPNRLIVELPDVRIALPPETSGPVGLVQTFRAGMAADNQMRVVIDVTQSVIVTSSEITASADGGGYRLAIEFGAVPAAPPAPTAFETLVDKVTQVAEAAENVLWPPQPKFPPPAGLGATALAVQPPLPRPAVNPRKKAERAHKPVIVIDPGHGGHDSGASKHGIVEKNVVLAFGLALRDKLNATGNYKVLMTRDTDSFLELEDRVELAERHDAALFIAVHADYAKSNARGATIFTLKTDMADDLKSSATDAMVKNALTSPRTAAARKVGGDGEVSAVKGILGDLAKQEVEATQNRSKLFAGTVIERMSDTTAMRASPDQQATFQVLQTAQFPSVLIELAYVTNKQDAENLKSDQWRAGVADSIVTAVDNYFSHRLARLPM